MGSERQGWAICPCSVGSWGGIYTGIGKFFSSPKNDGQLSFFSGSEVSRLNFGETKKKQYGLTNSVRNDIIITMSCNCHFSE